VVEVKDAEAAIELVQFAYFKKVLEKEKRSKRKSQDSDGETGDEEDEVAASPPRKKQKAPKRPARKEGDEGYDPYDMDEIADETAQPPTLAEERKRRASGSAPTTPVAEASTEITNDRLKIFRSALNDVFKTERAQSVTLDVVKKHMTSNKIEKPFTQEEIMAAVDKMQDENQVMLSDNILFLV